MKRQMTLEGVVSILEGVNPRMLETKLLGFVADAENHPEEASAVETVQ
jgi:chemotaxis protein MotA